jgi:hypothetical protein
MNTTPSSAAASTPAGVPARSISLQWSEPAPFTGPRQPWLLTQVGYGWSTSGAETSYTIGNVRELDPVSGKLTQTATPAIVAHAQGARTADVPAPIRDAAEALWAAVSRSTPALPAPARPSGSGPAPGRAYLLVQVGSTARSYEFDTRTTSAALSDLVAGARALHLATVRHGSVERAAAS